MTPLRIRCRITGFNEKSKAGTGGLINIGVYLFEKKALSLMPPHKNFSLEHDFFPSLADKEFYGYTTEEAFLDIGTPEKYKKVRRLLESQ